MFQISGQIFSQSFRSDLRSELRSKQRSEIVNEFALVPGELETKLIESVASKANVLCSALRKTERDCKRIMSHFDAYADRAEQHSICSSSSVNITAVR